MTPVPIRVYIAVIDGTAPSNWCPFSFPLSRVNEQLDDFEIEAVDPHYASAKISYLLRNIAEIDDADTPGIIAALVDGKDFADDDRCPNVIDRAKSLRTLGMMLSRQNEAYFRKYGFGLWLVPPEKRLMKMGKITAALTEPLALYLRGCDPAIVMVKHQEVLDAMVEGKAFDVADRQPRLTLTTKSSAGSP
jgi:hypothetical protein